MKKEYYVIYEKNEENKYKTNLTVVNLNKTLPNGNKEVEVIYIAEAADEVFDVLTKGELWRGKKNER